MKARQSTTKSWSTVFSTRYRSQGMRALRKAKKTPCSRLAKPALTNIGRDEGEGQKGTPAGLHQQIRFFTECIGSGRPYHKLFGTLCESAHVLADRFFRYRLLLDTRH